MCNRFPKTETAPGLLGYIKKGQKNFPEVAWPIIKQNVANTPRSLYYPGGGESLLLCNCIPEGDMKPELNQTQAIYPPEGPKTKVCVTTTIEPNSNPLGIKRFNFVPDISISPKCE